MPVVVCNQIVRSNNTADCLMVSTTLWSAAGEGHDCFGEHGCAPAPGVPKQFQAVIRPTVRQ